MNFLRKFKESVIHSPAVNFKTIVWNGETIQYNLQTLTIEVLPTFFKVTLNGDKEIGKVKTDINELRSLGLGQFRPVDRSVTIPYIDENLFCNIHNGVLTILNFEGNVYNLDEVVFECLKVLFPPEE